MIDSETRKNLELSLVDNFRTVSLLAPPELSTSIDFKVEFEYRFQDVLDKIVNDEERKIIINVSYPAMDIEWLKLVGDYWTALNVKFVSATSTSTTFDNWLRVDGATTAEFTFSNTEPVSSDLEIYTRVPTSSTSWLYVDVYDENGKLVGSSSIFNTELNPEGWTKTGIGINTGIGKTFTVKISEDTFGSNPIGIDIGRDSSDNVIWRLYSNKKSRVYGKKNRGRMRLTIYARDKDYGSLPEKGVFMVKDDIVSQIAEKIREFIWFNWQQYSLMDIGGTTILEDEYGDSVEFASATFDVEFPVLDFGTPERRLCSYKR